MPRVFLWHARMGGRIVSQSFGFVIFRYPGKRGFSRNPSLSDCVNRPFADPAE